jgi:N6-L-threonylcarbamoyladenine synthase
MIAIAGMMRLEHMSSEELAAATKRWSFSAKPRWTLSQAARPDEVNPRQRFRNH